MSDFKILFNHVEGTIYFVFVIKLSHCGQFQMIEFQTFLQPWRRDSILGDSIESFLTVSDSKISNGEGMVHHGLLE